MKGGDACAISTTTREKQGGKEPAVLGKHISFPPHRYGKYIPRDHGRV